MLCWIFPRCRKAHAWRRHSGLAMASHCTGFRSAARTSVPARLGGARSSMRTCRPAAPGSTSRTQQAKNPCRAHNDVRGDRPVRQPRRRPGQHETGQHIGLQRRQILRRHRRPRHPQISYGCQAQTRASSPSLSQQNERSRRYTFRNPEFTSDGRTRINRARRPRYWVYRGTGGLRELWGYFLVEIGGARFVLGVLAALAQRQPRPRPPHPDQACPATPGTICGDCALESYTPSCLAPAHLSQASGRSRSSSRGSLPFSRRSTNDTVPPQPVSAFNVISR